MPLCIHFRDLPSVTATTPRGCEECLAAGTPWVQLRVCLACGHVGCCDSSPGKHATKHFQSTKHPVMKAYEPGGHWGWCYVDELMADSVPGPTPERHLESPASR